MITRKFFDDWLGDSCGAMNYEEYLEGRLGALTFERDDARRWAAHFYRLWKATQNRKPVTGYHMLDVSPWKYSLDTMADKMRAAGIEPAGVYRFNHETGKDEIVEYPAIDAAMEQAAEATAARVMGRTTASKRSKGGKK